MSTSNLKQHEFNLEGLNIYDLEVRELELRLELAAPVDGGTPDGGTGGHNGSGGTCPSCHDGHPRSNGGGGGGSGY
jgi:hypothetical protein